MAQTKDDAAKTAEQIETERKAAEAAAEEAAKTAAEATEAARKQSAETNAEHEAARPYPSQEEADRLKTAGAVGPAPYATRQVKA